MSRSRIDLLTVGGFLAMFFATGAIETLRTALNGAYRVRETRPYPVCLLMSLSIVGVSAVASLVSTWLLSVGPALALRLEPEWMRSLFSMTWLAGALRYVLGASSITALLLVLHIWLAAGKRGWRDVWPGVALSLLLWLALASLWSSYLETSSYSRFYAGLSQLMVALLFFHFTAIAMILGAELNRGLYEPRSGEHAAAWCPRGTPALARRGTPGPMRLRALRTLAAALALCASGALAAELAGFSVPDRLRTGDRELVLNGIGVRTATAFKVKVYVAALYLERPSRDAAQVLASQGYKQIRMKYLRGFKADEMRRGWDYSFTQNCPAKSCARFQAEIAEFQAAVRAVEAGDVYDFRFFDDRVEIARPGAAPATLRGREFAALLLSTWIGVVPPTEELKAQLLGARR